MNLALLEVLTQLLLLYNYQSMDVHIEYRWMVLELICFESSSEVNMVSRKYYYQKCSLKINFYKIGLLVIRYGHLFNPGPITVYPLQLIFRCFLLTLNKIEQKRILFVILHGKEFNFIEKKVFQCEFKVLMSMSFQHNKLP